MSWQEVKALRDAGQLQQAIDTALKVLEADPHDYRTRSQYEWVIYACIKAIVQDMLGTLEKGRPISERDVHDLMAWMTEYQAIQPEIPGMACSNILGQLTKIGQYLPDLPQAIGWMGLESLRAEDWQPREYQGKTYSPLAVNLARTWCKWVKSHPDAAPEAMARALAWAERASEVARGDDVLWLKWDMTLVLRQMGDFKRAAELLSSVIKAKRNEFWVWAEAGRLYLSDQPELALSCFCRALECPAESKFLGRAHRELASLLADQADHAQASLEVTRAIEVRQAEGWPVGKDLEALIASPWYDPAAEGAEPAKTFYARHSPAALALCFDVVEARAANYICSFMPPMPREPRPGWKPRPLSRFAVMEASGEAWLLAGPGLKKQKLELGAPVNLVIGKQHGDERRTIVHLSPRTGGVPCDCTMPGQGVVSRTAGGEHAARVLILDTGEEAQLIGPTDDTLSPGARVQFCGARNPRNQRLEVFNVTLRDEGPDPHIRHLRGELMRHPKGFAFVEGAFAPPHLVDSLDPGVGQVVALAVYANNPAKGAFGWRVIQLRPGGASATGG